MDTMAKSRYEKYTIRKPNIMLGSKEVAVDKIETKGKPDTGPIVWISNELITEACARLESGIISKDLVVGTGQPGSFKPHKHENFAEIFTFLGTNPDDPLELGAEAEFWLGEGETLEKVVITTSTSVYVPAGVAHFPLVWKNVKRPCMFIVVACHGPEKGATGKNAPVAASLKGRPV
jgi:hypothetical protein